MIKNIAPVLLCVLLVFGLVTSSDARQWRVTPQAAAQEYVIINDQRSPNEIVLVFWMTPRLLPDQPQNETAKAMLTRNLLVGIAHADVSAGGAMSFRAPTNITLVTGGQNRPPLAGSQIEPASAGALTTMSQVFAQALGPLGKGTKWHVFDGSGISSCRSGSFAISYAGENYTYETPIPGC